MASTLIKNYKNNTEQFEEEEDKQIKTDVDKLTIVDESRLRSSDAHGALCHLIVDTTARFPNATKASPPSRLEAVCVAF